MAPRETVAQLIARLSTGFRRRFHKEVCLIDPVQRALHEGLEAVDPRPLMEQSVEEARFVVMDTETTGLRAYAGDEIVSIALLELEGLRSTGRELVTLVNPGRPIPDAATRIHGIRDQDVPGSPSLAELLPEVVRFIGGSVIVGHHINFDLRFLNRALQRELLSKLYHPWLDTMLLYSGVSGRVGHYTLEEVAAQCGVPLTDRHSAKGDAATAAAVFCCLVGALKQDDGTVAELIGRQYELGRFQTP